MPGASRIDLGLGRAPGTDQQTLRALRRSPVAADTFPADVLELQALLGPIRDGQVVRAVPGAGSNVPIWILGSSHFGAQLAAELSLPYAFASHFAPGPLMSALAVYRNLFKPSAGFARSYAMAGVNVVAAETDEEARVLFTSVQQQFANLVRGRPGRLQPPIDDIDSYWTPVEKAHASAMLEYSFVGSAETIRRGLTDFLARTRVDELIVVTAVFDHRARLRSYEMLADLFVRRGAHAGA